MKKYYEYEVTNLGTPYDIKVAYNQKVVQIHRLDSGITFSANKKALQSLSENAYSLYMYLIMHEQGRVWALSSKDIYANTHITKNKYQKTVSELIEKGYLTKGKIDGGVVEFTDNAYHLWEDPDNKVNSGDALVGLEATAKTKVLLTPTGRTVAVSDEVF